jgi:hypothetical protein
MATSGGKILLHQPYKSKTKVEGLSLKDQDLTFINTSKQICALTAGQLDPKREQELLFIGSETNLQVFGKSGYHSAANLARCDVQ